MAAAAVVSSMQSFPNAMSSVLAMRLPGESFSSLAASISLQLSKLPLEDDGIISDVNSLSVQLMLLLQLQIEFLAATAMTEESAESA